MEMQYRTSSDLNQAAQTTNPSKKLGEGDKKVSKISNKVAPLVAALNDQASANKN